MRLAAAADPAQFEFAQTRSEEIHAELWAIVEENVRQGRESAIMALFVASINEVIDVHSLRLAAVNLRLPRVLGVLMYGVLLLSFLLVGVANSGNQKRDFAAMVLFAMVFVAAMMIIIDLDRSQQGTITVGQTALTDLLQQMTAPAP